MANYTITPADVALVTVDGVKPLVGRGTADEAVNAGQCVSIDSTTGGVVLTDIATDSDIIGIALNNADAGQLVDYIQGGYCDLGDVGTAGDIIVASATAGALAPSADLLSTNVVSVAGYFNTAGQAFINIMNTDTAKG